MLATSGIGVILEETGYVHVGSYAMQTMTWRDLDFELYADEDWDANWEVGTRLAQTGWCLRLQCEDVSREGGRGLYWGLRVGDPPRTFPDSKNNPEVWKLDLWRAPLAAFQAQGMERRERWAALMTEERRADILAIKEALCYGPEYRKTIVSVHIYEAVLEHGAQTLEEFQRWWEQSQPAPGR